MRTEESWMSKKFSFAILALILSIIILPQTVSAHVLVNDASGTVGAVLHIVPDDDPVAGQTAKLFFDVQTERLNEKTTVLTVVNNATHEEAKLPVKVEGSSIVAEYVFPIQGIYQLTLTVAADKEYTFVYSQRVSRAVNGGTSAQQAFSLANFALIFSGTLFLFLLIVMFNYRKEIKKHSTF
jgi:hypothetical protein